VAELPGRHLLLRAEHDRAVALELKHTGIKPAKGIDQTALAVEENRVAVARLPPIDANRGAAAGLLREIARLAPSHRLGKPADTLGLASDLEHQRAQRRQAPADRRRIGVEDRRHTGIGKSPHRFDTITAPGATDGSTCLRTAAGSTGIVVTLLPILLP
jgi:hypothetical protein